MTSRELRVLLLAPLLSFAPPVAWGGPAVAELAAELASIAPCREILEGPTPVRLPDGRTAQSVVFRRSVWSLREPPQSGSLAYRLRAEAMQLPEAERLERMKRLDDHEQLWFVPLDGERNPAPALESSLVPEDLPSRYHREQTYLGAGHGYAWYGYLPIYEWYRIQLAFWLQGGDDVLAAYARGLGIRDGMTGVRVQGLLVWAGDAALPLLRATEGTSGFRLAVQVIAKMRTQAATQLLIEYARSQDPVRARRGRWALVTYPRPAAKDEYVRWLQEDAGRVPVLRLLRACAEVDEAALAPFLPRILESPRDPEELWLAFEMSRELAGQPVPEALRADAEALREYGSRGAPRYDPAELRQVVRRMLAHEDHEAAAQIALALALERHKGNTREANEAGVEILKGLPDGLGLRLVRTLTASCRDEHVRNRLVRLGLDAAR